MNNEPLFEFPCDFPIKVMGHRSDDFQALILGIVSRHAPDIDENQLRIQDSRNGRYRSVTVTVRAQNRDQLDAIYRDLSNHDRVVLTL